MAFDPAEFLQETSRPVSGFAPVEQKKTESGFDPVEFLGEQKTTVAEPEGAITPPLAPTYIPGPSGYNAQAIGQTLSPLVDRARGTLAGYVKNPAQAIVDVGAAHLGLPPPYATTSGIKGLYDTYQGVKNSLNTAQGLASQIDETPGVKTAFNKLIDNLPKEEALRMNDLINKRGAQGLKEFISSSSDKIKAMPEIKELAGVIPSRLQQAGRVLAPIGRTLGKVAGPLGSILEGVQGYNQAQQGDYTGAGISGLSAASMLNPLGLIAQPGISMMQSANNNFQQQTPEQQKESAMTALSGQGYGQSGEYFPQPDDQDKIDKLMRKQAAMLALRPISPTPPPQQ